MQEEGEEDLKVFQAKLRCLSKSIETLKFSHKELLIYLK